MHFIKGADMNAVTHTLSLSAALIAELFLVCLVSHCNYWSVQVKERLRSERHSHADRVLMLRVRAYL